MAASIESRIPKTKRNLISIIAWTMVIMSAVTLGWRYLSGNTLEHQRQIDDENKQRNAIAQGPQSTPSSIASMYDKQLEDASKIPPGSSSEPTHPTGQGIQSSAQSSAPTATTTPTAPANVSPSASQVTPGNKGGVPLRLPNGRPTPAGGYADSDPQDVGTGAPGGVESSIRARVRARSDFSIYEDSDISRGAAVAPTSPADALVDQLKKIQQGAGNQQSQVMSEYLKTMQTAAAGAGRPAASATSANRDPSQEWLSQQAQSSADDEPLRVTATKATYLVMEGTPIRIALSQNIKSDLPGEFTAWVTRDVYDSLGKGYKLICKGTRLRGKYNNEVSPGQDRLLFAFQSMRFPSGAKVALKGMPGSDLSGASGAEGDVDHHFMQIYGSALAVGTVAMLAGRAADSGSNVTINLGGTGNNGGAVATQALSDTVRQMLARNQNIKDTLSLKLGEELMIVTNRDMDLPPSLTGCPQ